MMVTQLTTFVPLCACNININLKMAAIAAEVCSREYSEENTFKFILLEIKIL